MNKLLTLLFLSISLACLAQNKDTTITLSALEKAKVSNFYAMQKEVERLTKDYYTFLGDFIQANGIDGRRVSIHPDSLKFIAPNKFQFILKRKKK